MLGGGLLCRVDMLGVPNISEFVCFRLAVGWWPLPTSHFQALLATQLKTPTEIFLTYLLFFILLL